MEKELIVEANINIGEMSRLMRESAGEIAKKVVSTPEKYIKLSPMNIVKYQILLIDDNDANVPPTKMWSSYKGTEIVVTEANLNQCINATEEIIRRLENGKESNQI